MYVKLHEYIVTATSYQKNAISSIVHCTIMCTQVTFQASLILACTFICDI